MKNYFKGILIKKTKKAALIDLFHLQCNIYKWFYTFTFSSIAQLISLLIAKFIAHANVANVNNTCLSIYKIINEIVEKCCKKLKL